MQLAEEHQAEELGGTQCQRISSHMGPLLLGNLLKGGCVLGKFFFSFPEPLVENDFIYSDMD